MQVNRPILKAAPTQKNQRLLSSVKECTKVSQRNAVLIQMTTKKKKYMDCSIFGELLHSMKLS